jgi:hypothetical protein
MKVVGHDDVIARLSTEVPHASVFSGLKGVGKWTTALWTVQHLGVPFSDVLQAKRLTYEGLKHIAQFSKRGGSTDAGQVVIARLGSHAMKYLPEVFDLLDRPSNTRFIFTASGEVAPGVLQRSVRYPFGLLSPEHVAEILIGLGAKPADAKATASYSAGTMDILWMAKQVVEVKPVVQQVLQAIYHRDEEALEMLASRWSDVATLWLRTWATERYTGRWRWYNDGFTEITDPREALRILLAVSEDVRPALIVRSTLMNLITKG